MKLNIDDRKIYDAKQRTLKIMIALFRFLLIFGLAFIILYPIMYMLSVTFRPSEQLYDQSVIWIPKSLTLANLKFIWKHISYPKVAVRTLAISLLNTVLQCISCSLVGYGFARFKFKGRNILFMLVIFTLIIPPQATTMPLYFSYVKFDFFGIGKIIGLITGEPWYISLINTPFPMAISALFASGIRAGLFIYMYRQFYRGMPSELEEAAYIDGSGLFNTYVRIMLPNTGPILLVTFLFSIVWYWNDYLYSALFYNKAKPLSLILANLQNELVTIRVNAMALDQASRMVYTQAACLLYILPLLIMYIFLQKYFTESVVRAGIVG